VFAERFKYPPTIQELAEILGISHSSVQEQISQLIRKGYLRREPGKCRGIVIVREPEGRVAEVVSVPIVGRVVAGRPLLAEKNISGEILVDASLLRRGARAAAVAGVAEGRHPTPAWSAPIREIAAALGYDDGRLSVLAGGSGRDRSAIPSTGNCGSDAGSEARQGVAR
jgi:DNA-binding transcriptional MocR family regulator